MAVDPRERAKPLADGDPSLVFDAPEHPAVELLSDRPTYRQFLESLGVAVYTTDAEGRITFFNEAAAEFWGRRPELGELWCGSWKLYWPDGRPMRHDECPMAISLREQRSARGYEAMAERPDGTRVSFVPYPTVVHDAAGELVGAVNVLVDVTERRRAEEALRAATDVKDEFLGLVSHELRTPVTTIYGNARLLLDRGGLTDLHAGMVDDIVHDAGRLRDIVDNLLAIARADDNSNLDFEPQVLSRVLSRIVDMFVRRHPERTIVVDADRGELVVEADVAYLELLILNLLSNADKYSPRSERVEVTLKRVGDEAQIRVLDRGIGIDAEDPDMLFRTFYRSDAARTSSSGLGIGLSACRTVTMILGGRIWARPRDGGGSEFGFALPLLPEAQD